LNRNPTDPLIVFERDTKPDAIDPTRSPGVNPKIRAVRQLSATVTIYARSSLAGARVPDHQRECEQIADALIVALYEWGATTKAGAIPFVEARYLVPDEYAHEFRSWPGVVYMIAFRVPRGVYALTYQGEARPEAAPVGVSNQTQVRLAGADPETPPATGCGA
jgi:hypothetical protein